jgi:SAM-dependent methyltransferase
MLGSYASALGRKTVLYRRITEWDWKAFEIAREALRRHAGVPLEGARVLDLGCGPRFPALLLFHTFGARATGIDTEVVDPSFGEGVGLRMIRRHGFARFLRSLAKGVLFDRGYYRELRRRAGRPLRFRGLDIRRMDAKSLAFPDGQFDLIHSNSVFEHLEDVPRALDELSRVLAPRGIASVTVHLFPSLSGGHRMEWAFPEVDQSRTAPPWDHLRERRFPAPVFLNRLRESDFQREYDRRFEVLEAERYREGERYLTRDLERELSGFTAVDLTTRAFRAVLRKRPGAGYTPER